MNNDLTIWQRAALEIIWFKARIFAMMPYWFKFYVAQPFFYFVLCYIVRYRRGVINMNLRNSFPEKSDRELGVIRRGCYNTLAEAIVCTINMAGITEEKIHRYLSVENEDEHRRAVAGKDWVAMAAHYGCWEYCSYWGAFDHSQHTVAVYHPLANNVMEHLYARLRRFEYSQTVPMKETMRFYLRNREQGIKGRRLVIGLISDQSPYRKPNAHWFRFLNQDTMFFDGAEQLALKCKLPIYFAHFARTARGCYRISFELIHDGVEEVAPNEVTERYVRKLEKMIVEHPELWVWSHRRWKRKRDYVPN